MLKIVTLGSAYYLLLFIKEALWYLKVVKKKFYFTFKLSITTFKEKIDD